MVRVRFAPSPTGPLHIGGVRTALFNYLFARQHKGKFILRIEDTDMLRFVDGAEKYIIESLNWCGLKFDEGPHLGGDYGPYRQSERKELYIKYAKQLVEDENAYYAFDTLDDLEKQRVQNANFQYDVKTRLHMKNSLALSAEETKHLLDSCGPYVIRIKIPENRQMVVQDLIRGEVHFDSGLLDDKIIFKSDGLPTYHLANIVDDHYMEITHVIRGEEWLPSTPLHVLLYEFLSWQTPIFAHLPLILKPQGNGKLSKRDGDKLGFPVFPLEWKDPRSDETSSGFREWGYLPEAFINLLALLGWNPGTEQEIFNIDELIEQFSLDKVNKSGAKFDPEKTKWFNHQYILSSDLTEYLDCFVKIAATKGYETTKEFVQIVLEKIRNRMNLLSEFWQHSFYFFAAPQNYSQEVINKHKTPESAVWLKEVAGIIQTTYPWDVQTIEQNIKQHINNYQIPMGKLFNLVRVALTGSNIGIGIVDILFVLGKKESIKRIELLCDFEGLL